MWRMYIGTFYQHILFDNNNMMYNVEFKLQINNNLSLQITSEHRLRNWLYHATHCECDLSEEDAHSSMALDPTSEALIFVEVLGCIAPVLFWPHFTLSNIHIIQLFKSLKPFLCLLVYHIYLCLQVCPYILCFGEINNFFQKNGVICHCIPTLHIQNIT